MNSNEAILREIPGLLCTWYAAHKRDLPWRRQRDAYAVWVSEIMLQQTRVEAVRPYYSRFMAALPDIRALADCQEDALLKLWEGLGYYSRVRNIQKAARVLAEQTSPGGCPELPGDRDALLKLPGIGEYTAGAIASIAFGQAVPAVDGNVLRILARLLADDRDILQPGVKKEYGKALEAVMRDYFSENPEEHPGNFNQALMDLGAALCLPHAQPLCAQCPLAALCAAHRKQEETAYPVRLARKQKRIEERTILLIRDGSHVVLRRRPPKGLLAGLYEFPGMEGRLTQEQALDAVRAFGLVPLQIRPLDPARHIFSHVEWRMTAYEIRIAEHDSFGDTREAPDGDLIFAGNTQIERDYPIPSAFSAFAARLQVHLGASRE